MPLPRKEVRAVRTVDFSRARRVEVQSSLARQTWLMEERERLEARRWGISVSRGEGGMFAVGWGSGGCREEVEEAMVDRLRGWGGLMCLVAGSVVLSIVTCRRCGFYNNNIGHICFLCEKYKRINNDGHVQQLVGANIF